VLEPSVVESADLRKVPKGQGVLKEAKDLATKEDNVLIRDFRKSDLDDLLRLLPECFAEEFEVSGFDPDHTRDMVNRAYGRTGRLILWLLRLCGKEPMKFLVAEVDCKVVGTTIIDDRRKAGSISAVMVHPDCRRKGIATRLMTNALDYIRERKKARAILYVMSANTPAMDMYVKLGFRAFERAVFFVGETDRLPALQDTGGVQIRSFHKDDLDAVYRLIRASEDPNRLRIFDFSKNNLRTPFLQRLFRFSTEKKMVAVFDGRIVGYAEAAYTTPKEVGKIGFIHVNPEGKSLGVEKMLINAAGNEIEKAGVRRIRIIVPATRQELAETVKNLGFTETLMADGMVAEFPS
jgi:ribosomal-protein-alanine N-acetyltransferase